MAERINLPCDSGFCVERDFNAPPIRVAGRRQHVYVFVHTTMAARAILSKQLRQVADGWAPDPMFAPQFKTFLTSLSEHPNLTREAVDAARALQDNRILQKVS